MKLPGLIDIHVHFRDPGQTHKEDFYTGTLAALAGGVTTVFDMPNNAVPIFTLETLGQKLEIAKEKAVCDYGLYFGTDGRNTEEFDKVKNLVIGLKVFLNLSTGKLLIEDEGLVEKVFATWPKEKVIIVHAESEKITLAIELAKKYHNTLHITHLPTKDDLIQVLEAKEKGLRITCDVTPHHLFLTDKDATRLGPYGEVKPSMKNKGDQDFLWQNMKYIDCIATDHAPHTKEEKESDNPPSGLPGLETMLPLLITAVRGGQISINEIIRLTNTNPQKIFGIKQSKETYIEVDTQEKYTIENKNLITKSGWSPFAGREVYGRIQKVFIRGEKVFENGNILMKPGFGKNVY